MCVIMTIKESVIEHVRVMEKAGYPICEDDLSFFALQQYGSLEFSRVETKKGRKGRPFSIYHTESGPIAFFPSCALLCPYKQWRNK